MSRKSKFTDAVVDRWGQMHYTDIASEVGCSVATVYNIAKVENLDVKTQASPHSWTEDETLTLLEWFSVVRPNEMCELLPHLSYEQIRCRAKTLQVNPYRSAQLAKVRHDLFSDVTVESAYWAGMLAADGWVTRRSDKNMTVSLSLSSNDLSHVEAFNAVTRSSQKVGIYDDNDGFKRAMTAVASIQMVKDLESMWSVTERKSKTLQPPTCLTRGTPEILAFISGYMDGDGFVGTYKMTNDDLTLRCGALGTKAIIDWSAEIINQELNRLGFEPVAHVHRLDEEKYSFPMYEWRVHGRAADALLESIYGVTEPFALQRKFGIWKGFYYPWKSTKTLLTVS